MNDHSLFTPSHSGHERLATVSSGRAADDLAGIDPAELFRGAIGALRRGFWIILLCVAIFAALGAAFAMRQEPKFVARSSLIIDPRVSEGMMTDQQVPTVLLADALVVDSEVEVLQSRQVLGRVIERLDLAGETRAALVEAGEPVPDEAELERLAFESLASRLDVEREGTTFVVRVSATAADPLRAAELANAVTEEYLAVQGDVRADQTRITRDWLRGELEAMSSELMQAEAEVELFLHENDIPSENQIGAVAQEISANEDRLIASRGELRDATAAVETIDAALAELADPENSRTDVAFRIAELATALGGPSGLRPSQVEDALLRLRDGQQARIRLAEAEIRPLEAATRALKDELAAINQKQIDLRQLERRASAMRSQYESLLAHFERTAREGDFFRSSARIIERAAPPAEPSNPGTVLLAGAAGAGGFVIAIGLIFLREQFNDSLRSSDDVTALGLPYLGALPVLGRGERRQFPAAIAAHAMHLPRRTRQEIAGLTHVAAAPYSFAAETIRRAAIALRRIRAEQGSRTRPVIAAMVSAVSDEGKTFTAANLAFFLAEQGSRVLLVDGDLRNPNLSRILGPLVSEETYRRMRDSRHISESDADAGDISEDAALVPVPLTERITLVGLADPSRTLAAEQELATLRSRVATWDPAADFVILDTAPLGYVSDSLAIAHGLDATILVARWGHTRAGTLRRLLAANRPLTEKLIGVCLGRARTRRLRHHEYLPVSDSYYRSGPAA